MGTETNGLRTMFEHHANQFLKFHFLPFLNTEDRTKMRGTCQTMKQNIPKPQYYSFKTKGGGDARARIEANTGFVETCGNANHGGDSSIVSLDLQSNVQTIIPSHGAFAALKINGKVITWGNSGDGGDSSNVRANLQSDVRTIVSTWYAFAALKLNGKVITWGASLWGGDSSNVSSYLQSDVRTIVSNGGAFAALKLNGKVITWGNPYCGGDFSNVSEFLQNGVIQIEGFERDNTFRATKIDGTKLQWPAIRLNLFSTATKD